MIVPRCKGCLVSTAQKAVCLTAYLPAASGYHSWMNSDEHRQLAAGPFVIRTTSPSDREAVSTLLENSYSTLLAVSYDSNILRLALPYITKANPALLASGTYYVAATESDMLVGCGGWTVENPGSGETTAGEAHIRHFAIHPEWTRRGIGASLVARCIFDARSLGIRKLHCFSTLNAEPFYRASGFHTVERIDVPMGPIIAFPAVLMKCEIV